MNILMQKHFIDLIAGLKTYSYLFLLLCFCLTGCFGSSDEATPESEPKELSAPIEGTQRDLFIASKGLYSSGLYSVAKDSFESLKDNYPFGPYAEFSEIKLADSYFFSKDYTNAAATFEEFIKLHPSSPAATYAMLQAGRSYHLMNNGVGRDETPLKKALSKYNELSNKYPDSIYRDLAQIYKEQIKTEILAYEIGIIDFYEKQGKEKAKVARIKHLESNWGPLVDLKQAVEKYKEAPLSVETVFVKGAQTISRQPQLANFQKEIANQNGNKLASLGSATYKTTFDDTVAQIDKNLNRIRRIECQEDQNSVFIYLEKDQANLDNQIIQISNQNLQINIPECTSGQTSINCFGNSKLELKESNNQAQISISPLTNYTQAKTIVLSNPARLLVVLK